jgi:hypothetical protein
VVLVSRGKWRPWRFSLRFLLLLAAVVAAGAAFFGWRERQLDRSFATSRRHTRVP